MFRKQTGSCLGSRGQEGPEETFKSDGADFISWIVRRVSWVCTDVKMDQVVPFKHAQFRVCQSYLDSPVFKMYLFQVLVLERHYFENLLTCTSLLLDHDR